MFMKIAIPAECPKITAKKHLKDPLMLPRGWSVTDPWPQHPSPKTQGGSPAMNRKPGHCYNQVVSSTTYN